jgi:hypothetical protein
MKKVLFFATFLLLAGVSVNAQSKGSCDKPCSSSEKASAQSAEDVTSKAITVANNDENIKVKTCEESGAVSFYRKEACEQSGKVSYTEVEYSESTGTFAVKASNEENANMAPAEVNEVKSKSSCGSKAATSSCGSKSSAKSSCGSKATKASMEGKKDACCAPAGAKPCGAKS